MSEKGYILLHRSVRDNWIWQSDEPFSFRDAWIDILLRANHEDKKVLYNGKLMEIKRGQFLTSICKLSLDWHWKRDKVYKLLNLLKNDGMITTTSNTKGTTVTIINYGFFQNPSATKRTGTGTTTGTTAGTTTGTQTKNDKELIKNEKESGFAETPQERLARTREAMRRLAEADARGEGGADNGWSDL